MPNNKKKPIIEDGPISLSRVIAQINKAAGETVIGRLGDMQNLATKRYPTGVKRLDDALGGGFPSGRMVELYGLPSCVDKDTHIAYKIRGVNGKVHNTKGGTIENLYYRFHKISRSGKGFYQRPVSKDSKITIMSMDNRGGIVENDILDVIMSGTKECYEVTTCSGLKITTTKDHKFFTTVDRFIELKNLTPGESILIRSRITGKQPIIRYSEVMVKYHPFWKIKRVDRYIYYRGKMCELNMEAHLNNLSPKEYREMLNRGNIDKINKLKFIQKNQVIHHIDHNSKNDNISNLQLMHTKEHELLHARKNKVFIYGGWGVVEDKIKSIIKVGERETYDICCKNPINNFIANSIIVHNSGKSLIASMVIANSQKDGGECVYVDAEGSFDPSFARKLGVDTNKLALVQMGIGEDIIDTIIQVLRSRPAVIVIDSVGAMITRNEFVESVEKVFMAPKARLMSRGLPKITAANKGTLIIFINQLRQIITTWGGGGTTTPGGMALGFYASVRILIKRDKDLLYEGPKTGHDPIGQQINFNITKSKVSVPHQTGSFKFYFDGRIQQ